MMRATYWRYAVAFFAVIWVAALLIFAYVAREDFVVACVVPGVGLLVVTFLLWCVTRDGLRLADAKLEYRGFQNGVVRWEDLAAVEVRVTFGLRFVEARLRNGKSVQLPVLRDGFPFREKEFDAKLARVRAFHRERGGIPDPPRP